MPSRHSRSGGGRAAGIDRDPVYGKPLLTFTCLASILANTDAASCEVIVVDDASPERWPRHWLR